MRDAAPMFFLAEEESPEPGTGDLAAFVTYLETRLRDDQVVASQAAVAARSLKGIMAEFGAAKGRKRVEIYFGKRPTPRYKPVAGEADSLRRIAADDSEVFGPFRVS